MDRNLDGILNVVFSYMVYYFCRSCFGFSLRTCITHNLSTESDGKPTLLQLLHFPGKSEEIDIPERISVHYKTFGIHLLKDDNGAKIDSLAKDEGESILITLKILSRWLQGEGMQPPTWSTITEALKKSKFGVLAEEISSVIEC